jgi:hypothetical protein
MRSKARESAGVAAITLGHWPGSMSRRLTSMELIAMPNPATTLACVAAPRSAAIAAG